MTKSLVVIPTYNEIDNIEVVINKIFGLNIPLDILVIDDNSPDGTANLVKKLQIHLDCKGRLFLEQRDKKRGLGTAYIKGFKWGIKYKYDYIFEMDADLSHDPKDLIRLQEKLITDTDVIIGSRYITGVNVVNWSMSRVLLSWSASKYVQFITGMDIKDTTAGFVGYRTKVLKTINLNKIEFIGYAFQIEMKYKAHQLGFKIEEIPIIFRDRLRGSSKMNRNIISEAIFGVLKLRVKALCKRLV